ncbi:symmetrical bis(5'-nucleosyl)-tetraphosphatase [Methylococcus capsulatus]|jgi:bis(5'-nucleosyl)-tetraphosphatase (symmetrical)|uniref:Bis(5'-nucleosyl)-tetraphosphatase, symmetrical n=1 Tax=Methylococcus capsulatus (strain ATCC 33009 / NCIMB 11132 / Bath) TaxID=243233 RepID=APAH_METCA|nr:symmetrical bis(5'-nucleosyl)-tetraphosphatase [Methylococcus capsulatus]Q60CE9.1 RecName: Full=Bis(5'-nucleosyl)-tetraphosphatase, symmetrical; AltName: Full=Ap4A hydrolase; AltName: Full=Diadenosine 5',5'''-P1,P4-tetraphosphate pyrophosphohydrolase; AltName: Full=Diadenosine tetraphosphatase [Methylococcus capsulatus str. Bath]AAU90598.1 bis(5'-nucleosyl)-tetraphosphatase, symmetrical [Methylococcus capsulatus str. Bath]QXP93981.1 symmetrical bis(5'-nucleosyl)-tetraphosphatase [Methylococcu
MAIYAIGDVQGCYAELRRLLELIRFDPAKDRLLFTGDLVNRGPQSLETLRFIRGLGPAAATVLGNHDLHLLAVACGVSRVKHKDTFGDVLEAADRDELLAWLRTRPLVHREGSYCLVHAGIPPAWNAETAMARAGEVETVLAAGDITGFCRQMYGDKPDLWSDDLAGWDRLRFITNALTRMRYCDRTGRLDFRQKGAPGRQPASLVPWFDVPDRVPPGATIVFGHWSTLGYFAGKDCYCLDTGCLWGGELTALKLDGTLERYAVPSLHGGYQKPTLAK